MNIEVVHLRFQTLVYGLEVLKKSFDVSDHVKMILRSLPAARLRSKVTAIQETKDLDKLSLENMISSLKSPLP